MLFNSWQFFVFFVVTTVAYFSLPYGMRWLLLLLASCAFYMAFVPVYILILAATIVIDYVAAIQIEKSTGTKRTLWLTFSIVFTCLILFFFKYFDFFAWNVNLAADWLQLDYTVAALHLLLPIGLSFHTFQSLSYVIEVYRGNQKAERHFGIYSLFVMFYPQLVAGPIERPQNLLHQFYEKHDFNYEDTVSGLRLIAWGLFKKVVIADRLAQFVSPVYGQPGNFDGGVLLIATLFFSFQIFCDFSGYTDIARGAARVLGFRLMENFDRPYSSSSLSEFWRRWHISLSSWLRDYVFEPIALALRHRGLAGIVVAFMVTFFISGLWHGANWTYVTWGLLNGLVLSLESIFAKRRRKLSKAMPAPLFNGIMWFITFSFINFSYIFFRAKSMSDAALILRHIGEWLSSMDRFVIQNAAGFFERVSSLVVPQQQFYMSCALIVFLSLAHHLHARFKIVETLVKSPWWVRWPAYQSAVFLIAFSGVWFDKKSFIYFQF